MKPGGLSLLLGSFALCTGLLAAPAERISGAPSLPPGNDVMGHPQGEATSKLEEDAAMAFLRALIGNNTEAATNSTAPEERPFTTPEESTSDGTPAYGGSTRRAGAAHGASGEGTSRDEAAAGGKQEVGEKPYLDIEVDLRPTDGGPATDENLREEPDDDGDNDDEDDESDNEYDDDDHDYDDDDDDDDEYDDDSDDSGGNGLGF